MTPEVRAQIAAQEARWLDEMVHDSQVDDGQHWSNVLAYRGWSIPEFPADLIELATLNEEQEH